MSPNGRRSLMPSVRWASGALLAALALAFVPRPAVAAQAPDTIEQHIELLSEAVSNQLVATTISTPRGELFGTSKFAPTPTATFEIVAKVTGAQGTAGWNVATRDVNGNQISTATVAFGAADSGWTHKYASYTWPTAWTEIGSITLTPQGTIPGAIDVRKAYVKLNQNGIITKTLGRLPMGTKQLAITNTNYTALTDPNIFKYNTADFDPAPVIKLRASGRGSPCYFNVSLYNDAGTMVPGSELTFYNGVGSQESGALSLTNGVKYQVRVKIFTGCIGEGPSGDSPDSGDPEVPSGDFYSADLIFEQSTADTAGITKTVGFYPGVTAAVDSATNNEDLNFSFRAPTINIPNAVAGDWTYVAKRTSGSGFVGVSLKQGGSVIGAAAATSAGTTFDLSAPVTLGSFGSQTLTKSHSSLGSATTARISASLMKLVLALRDVSAPTFTVASNPWTNTAFSPALPSANPKSKTKLVFSMSDFSAVTYDLSVSGPTPFTVEELPATGTGLTKDAEWEWDGRVNGLIVGEGTYTVAITATDGVGNVSPPYAVSQGVVVDITQPTISNFGAATNPVTNPVRFSPNTPPDGFLDSVTYSASFSETSTWTLGITSGPSYSGSGASFSQPWSGSGVTLDGTYTAAVTATDLAGNAATSGVVSVIRDTIGPVINGYVIKARSCPTCALETTRAFSPAPNPDGAKDTVEISATLAGDTWTPYDWTFRIRSGSTYVRTITGTGTTVSATWDGTDDAGNPLPDGSYTAFLTARDFGQNPRTESLGIQIDRVRPTATGWKPGILANTLWKQPNFEVVPQDELSGIVSSSRVLKLDDTPITSSYDSWSGKVTATAPAPLSANTDHTLTFIIDDEAGNRATIPSRFRVIGIQQESAAVSIPGVSATTPPATQCVTNCTVTFQNVKVNVGAHTTTLSSSLHPGTGHLHRPLNLATAIVTWQLPGGVTTTSPAGLTSTTSDETLRVDDPLDQSIALAIPAADVNLGAVPVPVPATVPPGTTGVLSMATGSQAPGCTDSLAAVDPANCGGPASSAIDPLDANFKDLYMTYGSGTTAIPAGDDLEVAVTLHSRCVAACGDITVTGHYTTIDGTTVDLPAQVVPNTLSQQLTFEVPGEDVYWWNTQTRTPYVFGYWFDATQTQSGQVVPGRSPIAAGSEHERNVANRLRMRVERPNGSAVPDAAWILSVLPADDSVVDPVTMQGFTASDGSINVEIPYNPDVAAAATSNRGVANFELSAFVDESGDTDSIGFRYVAANFGDSLASYPGIRLDKPSDEGVAPTSTPILALDTSVLCDATIPTAMMATGCGHGGGSNGINAATCEDRNRDSAYGGGHGPGSMWVHYDYDHGRPVGNMFDVDYGYGLATEVTLGTGHAHDNFVEVAIKVGPNNWYVEADGGYEVRTGNTGMSESGVTYERSFASKYASYGTLASYYDLRHSIRWTWYPKEDNGIEIVGDCIKTERAVPTAWNPLGINDPMVLRDFNNGSTHPTGDNHSRDDCVEACSDGGNWFHVSSTLDFFKSSGTGKYKSGSFCVFVCVGNTSSYQEYQKIYFKKGTGCLGGWYVYPAWGQTMASAPRLFVDSGDMGPALNTNGTKPQGC